MDLNPELLSASDRLCVGLVVQCMFQCRVHNLNLGVYSLVQATVGVGAVLIWSFCVAFTRGGVADVEANAIGEMISIHIKA
jgi:hypothetical protein